MVEEQLKGSVESLQTGCVEKGAIIASLRESVHHTKKSLEDQIRLNQPMFESQLHKAKEELTRVSETNAYTTNLLGHKDSEISRLSHEFDRSKSRVLEPEAGLAASCAASTHSLQCQSLKWFLQRTLEAVMNQRCIRSWKPFSHCQQNEFNGV